MEKTKKQIKKQETRKIVNDRNRYLGEPKPGVKLYVLQCPRCAEFAMVTNYPVVARNDGKKAYKLQFLCHVCKKGIPEEEVYKMHGWLKNELKSRSIN